MSPIKSGFYMKQLQLIEIETGTIFRWTWETLGKWGICHLSWNSEPCITRGYYYDNSTYGPSPNYTDCKFDLLEIAFDFIIETYYVPIWNTEDNVTTLTKVLAIHVLSKTAGNIRRYRHSKNIILKPSIPIDALTSTQKSPAIY